MATPKETPEAGPGAIARWIALLDQAETIRRTANPRHPTAQQQVSRAIDSLLLYEHQMVPHTRQTARERLWRRDRPNEPLPKDRQEWERCRCMPCVQARGLARLPAPEVWQVQAAVVRSQATHVVERSPIIQEEFTHA